MLGSTMWLPAIYGESAMAVHIPTEGQQKVDIRKVATEETSENKSKARGRGKLTSV